MQQPTIRPATLDDAALAADLMTAAYPAYAADPIVTRYRWDHPRKGWSMGRFIAEVDGQPLAFVDWLHGPPEQDPERHCEVAVALDRVHLDVPLLVFLWRWVTDEATSTGSRVLEGRYGANLVASNGGPQGSGAFTGPGFQQQPPVVPQEVDFDLQGQRERSRQLIPGNYGRGAGY